MTLYVNTQEYNTLKEWLPPDTVVVKPEELGTDAVVQGVEKGRMYERKDLKDFLASVQDGRVFKQLKTLSDNKENYEPYLIVEIPSGLYDNSQHKWLNLEKYFELYPEKELMLYSTMVAIRAFDVGLIITTGPKGTVRFLINENKRLGKPKTKRDFPERQGMKSSWSKEQKLLYFYDAFGHEFAKSLGNTMLKEMLASPLSKEELLTKLPVTYKSGKTIPKKYLDAFVELLGFPTN